MSDAEHIESHAVMLRNRLRKRGRALRRWAKKEKVSCYRLYDRDIPEIPLMLDRYEGHLHLAWLVPRGVEGSHDHPWIERMLEVISEVTGVAQEGIFVKLRQRGAEQYGRQGRRQRVEVVEEAGLKFQVNLSDFIDTGLFLDHRRTRARVRAEAKGKKVLNLFAYTGAFTVYAAAGGASETMTVDLSSHYLEWAQRNLALNGLADKKHQSLRADVIRFLDDPRRKDERYDIAIVDPPTHSVSKRMEGAFEVQRDHASLLQKVFALMKPGGVIYFSNNYRRFELDDAAIPGEVEEITASSISEDFRRSAPHRCWRIVKA